MDIFKNKISNIRASELSHINPNQSLNYSFRASESFAGDTMMDDLDSSLLTANMTNRASLNESRIYEKRMKEVKTNE